MSRDVVLYVPYFGVSFQGSKCPSLPGFTHWVNPGKPGLGFKPDFGKSGEYWVINILNVQMFRIVQIGGY